MDADEKGIIRKCPNCGQANRLPYGRLHDAPRCAKCHQPLAAVSEPVDIQSAAIFDTLIGSAALPVLVISGRRGVVPVAWLLRTSSKSPSRKTDASSSPKSIRKRARSSVSASASPPFRRWWCSKKARKWRARPAPWLRQESASLLVPGSERTAHSE